MAWVDARGVCRGRRPAMIYHNDLLASERACLCVVGCDLIGRHLLTFSLPCVCSASMALLYPPGVFNVARASTPRHKRVFPETQPQGLALSQHGVPLLIFRSVYRGRSRQSEVSVTCRGFNARSNRLFHPQNPHRNSAYKLAFSSKAQTATSESPSRSHSPAPTHLTSSSSQTVPTPHLRMHPWP